MRSIALVVAAAVAFAVIGGLAAPAAADGGDVFLRARSVFRLPDTDVVSGGFVSDPDVDAIVTVEFFSPSIGANQFEPFLVLSVQASRDPELPPCLTAQLRPLLSSEFALGGRLGATVAAVSDFQGQFDLDGCGLGPLTFEVTWSALDVVPTASHENVEFGGEILPRESLLYPAEAQGTFNGVALTTTEASVEKLIVVSA